MSTPSDTAPDTAVGAPDTSDSAPSTPDGAPVAPDTAAQAGHLNEVVLVGRASASAEPRELPSGDRLLTLRVVVDRPPTRGSTRRAVDVIDVACWTRRTQRVAERLAPGDGVRVEGALRRRFFAGPSGRASRYEVEAARVRRVRLPGAS